MSSLSLFQRYLLPGFLFQSVVIAAGYGTGRELVEFFLTEGPAGGLLGVSVTTIIWSAVCAATFEYARRFQAYDYRTFFTRLLGRAWITYELAYLVLLLIILGVIAAAAGAILDDAFGLPPVVGVLTVTASVGWLVLRGSRTIETAFSVWSFVLYAVYLVLFVAALRAFGADIGRALPSTGIGSSSVVAGVRYAAYNAAIIPAVLFGLRHVTSRREAVTAGLLAGPIAIAPGLLFYVVMVGHYPEILDRAVPANLLLEALGSTPFQLVFQVVLFGTLVETGTGLIHAINERLAPVWTARGRTMPTAARPAVAIGLLACGAVLANVGLVDLIARGYGTLTWVFLLVFVLPILTRGLWQIRQARLQSAP